MTEQDMKLLSNRLRRVMAERGLVGRGNQARLAEASGATRGAVNQWLNGTADSIKYEFAENLEREFGFAHEWIMTGKGRVYTSQPKLVPEPSKREETVLWDEVMELLSLFRGATKFGRDTILDAARAAPKRKPGSAASNDAE